MQHHSLDEIYFRLNILPSKWNVEELHMLDDFAAFLLLRAKSVGCFKKKYDDRKFRATIVANNDWDSAANDSLLTVQKMK